MKLIITKNTIIPVENISSIEISNLNIYYRLKTQDEVIVERFSTLALAEKRFKDLISICQAA